MLLEILNLLLHLFVWMKLLGGDGLLPDTEELKDLLGQVTVEE